MSKEEIYTTLSQAYPGLTADIIANLNPYVQLAYWKAINQEPAVQSMSIEDYIARYGKPPFQQSK